MSDLRKAKVVAVYPGRRRVDLVFLDTGERIAEVEVMTPDASTDSGTWNVPSVPRPATEAGAGRIDATQRNLIALCGLCQGRPVVLGFTHPSGGSVVFDQQDRSITKHASGSYVTMAPDGSIEVFHASGAYLRIGDGAHEDLGPLSAGAWPAASGSPAKITLATSGFMLTVEPGGAVKMQAVSLDITADTINLNGATTINGPLTQGKGDAGGAATMLGPLNVTNDVKAGTISLEGHHHVSPAAGVAV